VTSENPYQWFGGENGEKHNGTRREARALLAVAAISTWFGASMHNASADTSWEHHPFAGPFVILKEASRFSNMRYRDASSY
jgi:hypothetical protein